MKLRKIRVQIRIATEKDALEFLRLEAMCFEMKANRDLVYFWTPVVSYLWTFKAEIGSKIVGGIIAMPTRKGEWYINSLFVHPKYRKHRIATRLLERIIKIAGGKPILLDVKTDRKFLMDFYREHGFVIKKFNKNYYRDGTDRYIMLRR